MSDTVKLIIKISKDVYTRLFDSGIQDNEIAVDDVCEMTRALRLGTPLTQSVLADALMEERIRGKLDSDTTFEKDIIRDVKCRLTVSIIDHRPCYCGAELREVWRESENVVVANKNLCDSCTTKNCIFQSGIVRNHCDFYRAESEDKE